MFTRRIPSRLAYPPNCLAQLFFQLPLPSLFLLVLLGATSISAQAATFTVNTTQDTSDGVCSTATNGCSLRDAITSAGANVAVADTIVFNIPSSDAGFDGTTYNIKLSSDLPDVPENTTLDGTTQSGNSNPNGPEIQLTHNNSFVSNGLNLPYNGSLIKGLIINGAANQINIEGSNNAVQGCYIGTDPTGKAESPNNNIAYYYSNGIGINGSNNVIGGIGTGQGNRIGYAYLPGDGVDIYSGSGNTVRGNAIFANTRLGINLFGNYGVEPNDDGDSDGGTNGSQNFPVIKSVVVSGTNTVFNLELNSQPNKTYTIDIYDAGAGGSNGYGQGEAYIGTTTINTVGNNGTGSFTVARKFPDNTTFSATATDSSGNTSEFSQITLLNEVDPFIVRNTNDDGLGSLRLALKYANAHPDTTVKFNIPKTDSGYNATTGVFTINLLTALPNLTSNGTVIDGNSQTTFSGNTNSQGPEIQVLGRIGNVGEGFGSPYVAGFTINNGFRIKANNCSVNNLVLNNFVSPVYIEGPLGQNNTIRGCFIGVDSTGNIATPNPNNSFTNGISILNSSNNTIGGIGAGQGNRIAYANGNAIIVSDGTGNSIRGNAIYANGELGIDLGYWDSNNIGVTANDNNDVDYGANNLQNFPTITGVTTANGNTSIALSLNSIANKTYAIDVYRLPSEEIDATGYGEGKTYIGSVNLTTNGTGNGTATLNVTGNFSDQSFSATATDQNGNTSEFGRTFIAGGTTPAVVKNTNDSGVSSLRWAIKYANGNPGTTISFAIPNTDAGYNPATGVYTIRLLSSLPDITGAGTIIDGGTQTGIANTNSKGPEIEITSNGYNVDGTGYGPAFGIYLQSSNCSLKGVIINGFKAMVLVGGNSNLIQGCYIGTDATGKVASPNNNTPAGLTYQVTHGIGITGENNIVGGTSSGQGNIVAFLPTNGINIYGNGNRIRGNSIFGIAGLGIDLGPDGSTANDTNDVDSGANDLQNFPVINSVTPTGSNTSVALSLNSIASKTYTIDLYRTPLAEANALGYGEGKTYAGSVNLTTNTSGNGTVTATISGLIGTDIITATATDPTGNTSEFSPHAAGSGPSPLVVTNTADSGTGSLRKAIEFANQNYGGTISFKIPTSDSGYNPSTGVWTISPLSDLPMFGAPIVLDGSTQTGNTNANGPEIEIRGSSAALSYGLASYEGSVIRGLLINGFSTQVVLLGNATVESCYIGTNYNGTAASPNNNVRNPYTNGIEGRGEGNTIGGSTAAKGNVIGFAKGDSNTNLTGNGIYFESSFRSSLVRNNTIIGNAHAGIGFKLQNLLNVIRDNTIRDNSGPGINIPTGFAVSQNTIRFNSIYNNGGLGIDIGADGVTPNDIGDLYSGSNGVLNYPILTTASVVGSNTTINGTYNSQANATYEIDFYGNAAADASGYGEGQYFLGTVSVTTDASGNATFSKILSNVQGTFISATATVINNPTNSGTNGDTSEFSNTLTLPSQVRSVHLITSSYSVSESSSTVSIRVIREGLVAGEVKVNYATSNGTAMAGSDYTATSGTLTWPSGDVTDKFITVPINNDSIDEVDENFSVTLSSPNAGTTLGSLSSASVTITDNDTSNLGVEDVNTTEGDSGTKNLDFKVRLTTANSRTITVDYATADGTTNNGLTNPATTGTDFIAKSGTLTFLPGETSKTVSVPIIGDKLVEPNEVFRFILSNPTIATIIQGTAFGGIVNDDVIPPSIRLGATTYSVNESAGTATITVVREASNVGAVSVKYATSNGTASAGSDYTATSGTLGWADGDGSSKTITVPINNDTLDEVNETFNITLSQPSGSGSVLGTPASAVVTIVDNDTDSVFKLKAATYSVNESAGTATITVARENSATNAVSVKYATSNGTNTPATAGVDYTAVSGTLNWADGDGADKTITVPITNDSLDEGNETFNLTLSQPSAGGLLGTPANAVVTITDDDASSLTIDDATAIEGDSGTTPMNFVVHLSNPSTRSVTVNYTTTTGATSPATVGTDYLTTSGTLTFAAGETSKTIPVAIVGDKKSEPLETVRVVLSNPTNTTIARNTGVGTILDNDSKAALSISDAQVVEGDTGTTNAVFTVKLASAIGKPVTVKYAAAKGTATAGTDFTVVSGTLTFAAGETNKTLSVPVKGDTIDELDEQFSVKLSSATNASVTDATGTGTIKDDDATPALNVTGASVLEGNKGKTSLNFVITLNRASSLTVKVNYQTIAASVSPATVKTDYVEIKPKALTFKPGETSKTVTVTVNADTVAESDERVGLRLSSPTNATLAVATAEGIILNDDGALSDGDDGQVGDDPLPTLSIDDAKTVEGNSGTTKVTFTVKLSKASVREISLAFTTANLTAVAGSDYESKSGNLTFEAGQTSKTISVNVKGDKVRESDEQFKVLLSRSINATISRETGIGTITNDDSTSSSISQS